MRATAGETSEADKAIEKDEEGKPAPKHFWVLDTDYETYAIHYNCINTDASNKDQFISVYSRSNTMDDATLAVVKSTVQTRLGDEYIAKWDEQIIVDHSGCGDYGGRVEAYVAPTE